MICLPQYKFKDNNDFDENFIGFHNYLNKIQAKIKLSQ